MYIYVKCKMCTYTFEIPSFQKVRFHDLSPCFCQVFMENLSKHQSRGWGSKCREFGDELSIILR